MSAPRALPAAYSAALTWRGAALGLWLGRLALAPFGVLDAGGARWLELLLAPVCAVGLIGALWGARALWSTHRSLAAAELLATGVALVPTIGWCQVMYGAPPLSDATLPLGVAPGWMHGAALLWLGALAAVGRVSGGLRPAPVGLVAGLVLLDLPWGYSLLFALDPRLAEAAAPLAVLLGLLLLNQFKRSIELSPAG